MVLGEEQGDVFDQGSSEVRVLGKIIVLSEAVLHDLFVDWKSEKRVRVGDL